MGDKYIIIQILSFQRIRQEVAGRRGFWSWVRIILRSMDEVLGVPEFKENCGIIKTENEQLWDMGRRRH